MPILAHVAYNAALLIIPQDPNALPAIAIAWTLVVIVAAVFGKGLLQERATRTG